MAGWRVAGGGWRVAGGGWQTTTGRQCAGPFGFLRHPVPAILPGPEQSIPGIA
jgi:hypothetical protein